MLSNPQKAHFHLILSLLIISFSNSQDLVMARICVLITPICVIIPSLLHCSGNDCSNAVVAFMAFSDMVSLGATSFAQADKTIKDRNNKIFFIFSPFL